MLMAKINDVYDIGAAFEAIEDELTASMIRNMKRHKAEEAKEGYEWAQWQAEQLRFLEEYKKKNQKKYEKKLKNINSKLDALIRAARDEGGMQQEIQILNAIKKGFKGAKKVSRGASAEFFRINDRKLDALIKAMLSDMEKAETAVLRMANDQYRKIIFNAQVYANTGAGTYEKAVDMATKDFLSAGLNCVQYKNGARHTLADYADMAIRTASKRAYLQGEGEKRQEWGISTVIVNKRGNPCPRCLPFCGKVLIDDVWSGGKESDGPYPLMSKAIEHGLYHPRCKDSHTTYFPGVSTADDSWTQEELEAVGQANSQEARRQYAARQAAKYERLAKYSLDPDNRKQYAGKAAGWESAAEEKKEKADIEKSHGDFIKLLRKDEEPSSHKSRMALYSEMTEMIEDENLNAPFAYIPDLDVLKYNSKAPYIEEYDMNYVFAHEITHRMDELEYHSWENERFLQAIDVCAKKVYAQREEILKWFEPGGKYEKSFAVSDIIDALSDGEITVPVGHGKEYWETNIYLKAVEIFANLSSIDVLGLDEKEDIFEELFNAYKEIVK